MIRRLLLLAAFAGSALPMAARGNDQPPAMPQRDVDVHYQIAGRTADAPPRIQRVRWSVAAGKMRVDPPSPGLYMIGDYRSKQMEVVQPDSQAVLDLGPGSFNTNTGTMFTQLGADQVLGFACTDWQTQDNAGTPTVLCLTRDGVMLRASQGDRVLVQASAVDYAAQDPAAFAAPESYRHVAAAAAAAAP